MAQVRVALIYLPNFLMRGPSLDCAAVSEDGRECCQLFFMEINSVTNNIYI